MLVGALPFVGKFEVGLVQTSFAVVVEFGFDPYPYFEHFVSAIPLASCMGSQMDLQTETVGLQLELQLLHRVSFFEIVFLPQQSFLVLFFLFQLVLLVLSSSERLLFHLLPFLLLLELLSFLRPLFSYFFQ